MVLSMLCWGSWANTVKLCPGYRFQLFYWDYVIGLFAGVLLWGLTLGTFGTGQRFLEAIKATSAVSIGYAILAGVIFNTANLLLVAAIEVAGLAVAFPVGIGLALIVGAVSSYVFAPAGNPILLFGGIALVVVAIVCDAMAYRMREQQHPATSRRGIVLSLAGGLLMGSFYPFVSRAMAVPGASGPYATSFFFLIGVAICAAPLNALLMRTPLDGQPAVSGTGYVKAEFSWHVWGVVGGAIWCTGAIFNFVASRSQLVGPAVSYSIGQGATMISAAWGVFVWKEFAGAPTASRRLLVLMFLLFLAGLSAIALSPLY
jgi:glucose uptake protein